MFARKLAWASDEDVQDNCKDAPKLVWLLDIQDETHPVIIGTAPLHANDGESCTRGGRFGAHNLHPNFPGPLYKRLQNTTVASWFNGGVRIFRAVEGPKGVPGAPSARRGDRLLHPGGAAEESERHDSDQPRDRRRDGIDLRQRSLHRRPLHPSVHRQRADGLA